jgi:hypothetical protein
MIIGKREEVVRMGYYQLDELIQEQFSIPTYESVAAEEWGNDEEHRFDLTSVKEQNQYDAERIEKARAGDWEWATHALLEDLVRREILEPAIYIVSVSW